MNAKSTIDRLIESPLSYFRNSDMIDGELYVESTGVVFVPYLNADHGVLPVKIDYPELMDDIRNFSGTVLADDDDASISKNVVARSIVIESDDDGDDYATYHGHRAFYCTAPYLKKNFKRLHDAIKTALDNEAPTVENSGFTRGQPINQSDARRLLKTHRGHIVTSDEVDGMQSSGALAAISAYDIDRRSIVAFPYKGRDKGNVLLIFTSSPDEAEALVRDQTRKSIKRGM